MYYENERYNILTFALSIHCWSGFYCCCLSRFQTLLLCFYSRKRLARLFVYEMYKMARWQDHRVAIFCTNSIRLLLLLLIVHQSFVCSRARTCSPLALTTTTTTKNTAGITFTLEHIFSIRTASRTHPYIFLFCRRFFSLFSLALSPYLSRHDILRPLVINLVNNMLEIHVVVEQKHLSCHTECVFGRVHVQLNTTPARLPRCLLHTRTPQFLLFFCRFPFEINQCPFPWFSFSIIIYGQRKRFISWQANIVPVVLVVCKSCSCTICDRRHS